MTEELARAGGPLAAAGLAVLVLARPRPARLAGLAAWGVGAALLVPVLAPSGHGAALAGAAAVGVVLAAALAAVFRRRPWALAYLALLAAVARIPVSVGDTSANLLLALYVVVSGGAFLLAWELLRDRPRARELGPVAWPLALLVLWLGLTAAWSKDVPEAAVELLFVLLPFGLLSLLIARLPWRARPLEGLYGLLGAMAVVFAAVGISQWLLRDIFWNPKIDVANAYESFFRVNSVFWDPSIYGRFLVVGILAALAALLLRASPRREPWLALAIVVTWVGLFFSFSQSSFAALVAGVALLAALVWRWRALLAIGLVAAVMIPIGAAAPQLRDARESLFSTATFNHVTSGRSKLVSNGVRIAADHPVAGVGLGGFKRAYAERLELGRKAPPKAASHTTPVTVAAEAGFVGLGLLVWLVVSALLTSLRDTRGGRLARVTGWVSGLAITAIFVHSLFYNAFFEDPMTWGFVGLGALAAGKSAREPA